MKALGDAVGLDHCGEFLPGPAVAGSPAGKLQGVLRGKQHLAIRRHARVPKIPPKSTSAIATTSNTLLVSVAATPHDMTSPKMEEDSTARAHKKQRRSDMRGANTLTRLNNRPR